MNKIKLLGLTAGAVLAMTLGACACTPAQEPDVAAPTASLRAVTPGGYCYTLNAHGQHEGTVYTCKGPGGKKWRR